jgi:uncharacterized protein (DUF2147 family)
MRFLRNVLTILFVCLLCTINVDAIAQSPSDALVGVWLPSNGKARIQIYKKGEKLYGRIVWLREPNDPTTNKPKVDKNNPIESMRTAPLLGYSMLREMESIGDNKWENGTIYDPENGSTYSCKMELTDSNTLDVRGFIGVAVFGRTDTWKRLQTK